MENFLLNVLSGIVTTIICCTAKYIYKKVKSHSKMDCTPNVGQYI